jgi:anti-sigma factor RsiW
MDCALMQPDLIAYQLAELEDPARARLETHLHSCPTCLRDFLALKRSLEIRELAPSAAARTRLRDAVVGAVTQPRAPSGWSWWERPLAIGFTVAAVTLAAFAAASLAASPGAAPHGWVVAAAPG